MISLRRVVAGAATVAVLGVAGVAQAYTVPNFSGPGVSSPGYPDFWGADTTASLSKNSNGTFTLSISGNSGACGSERSFSKCSEAIFNFPNGAYLVGNETLNITANLSSSGAFLSGTYEIDGTLAASSNPSFHTTAPPGKSWGPVAYTDLFSTTLTNMTIDGKNEALGFGTTNFGGWANQTQFTGGSKSESLWLYALFNGTGMGGGGWQGSDNSQNSAWNAFLAELKSGKGLKANTFYGIASINTVPIPGALWLFGSSLMGLGGMIRRRKQALRA
jgi:hypothetical protein